MTEWQEIRRLHVEEGVPKRALARKFGRDVKTIRRLLARNEAPGRRSPSRSRKLDPFREAIHDWLVAEPGLTAAEVRRRIAPHSGPVTERTVRSFLRKIREEIGHPAEGVGEPVQPPDGAEEVLAEPPGEDPPPEAPAEEPLPDVRTPPHPGPLPQARPDGTFDLLAPANYLNRELTWLNFCYRVLGEAVDERTPLLERLKFLSIVNSNLDEFFMKRVGGLKQQVGAGVHTPSVDGRTPQQQIDECQEVVRDLGSRVHACYEELMPLLAAQGIEVTHCAALTTAERDRIREQYIENVFPVVTPQATDPAHPFPFISNLSLNLLVSLRHGKEGTLSLARVKVPVGLGAPRFLQVDGGTRFVPLEDVMADNLDLLFPGMLVESVALFRVTRNANTARDEERAEDLLAMIETELRERRFAPVVRLEVSTGMAFHHRGMLSAELGLDENRDVYEVRGMLGLRDVMELVQNPLFQAPRFTELFDLPHHPVEHPALLTDRSIFHVLRDAGSILVHHPYHSFPQTVERFLREAAADPKVLAIKMTVYRTSESTRAVDFLVQAARNGKQVAVVVELKARFDEAANIRWAARMEEAGVHVTYGVMGLKTHCKAILVVRRDYNGLRLYAHVGTGNYHAGTARIYSDIGMLTSDHEIGRDLTELFNYLTTGYKPKRSYRRLLPAPKHLKKALLAKIDREIAGHTPETPGRIQIKANALEDLDVARSLYRAAQAGVEVELFVRDSCRVRAGVPGLSENIRVVSIVGRFLEHARIYYFRNGGREEFYIGSADCMTRNLEARVELLCPVLDPDLRLELRNMLDLQARDRRCAWEMQPDGSYRRRFPPAGVRAKGSQARMVEWAEKRMRQAARLRRRKPRSYGGRNR